MDAGAAVDGLRQSRSPRDDGPGRPQTVATRADVRLFGARGGRGGAGLLRIRDPVSELPLFPVTTVGSWPRSRALLASLRALRSGEITRARHERAVDDAVREAVEAQHRAGVDLITDGEQSRDNFYSFVAERVEGVRLMTLSEMLDHVEDKEGFGRLLDTLDVPAYSIRNPTCIGRVRPREPLAQGDLERVRRFTGL